jgi:hypothetical protein
MRDDKVWWFFLAAWALGALVAWWWVARLPSDPDRWVYAIVLTCCALFYEWKRRRRK